MQGSKESSQGFLETTVMIMIQDLSSSLVKLELSSYAFEALFLNEYIKQINWTLEMRCHIEENNDQHIFYNDTYS